MVGSNNNLNHDLFLQLNSEMQQEMFYVDSIMVMINLNNLNMSNNFLIVDVNRSKLNQENL